ncbi:MAG: CHAT domain-containing protein [Okeania sp. SIO2D1]|nr:CHAT domain-containing protein [Okeania sp. SIO2D1]
MIRLRTNLPNVGLIVSLWSLPDSPTTPLMTEFYQNLQSNPDKAQALRQAMLTRKKVDPNPANWAGFMLLGEAEVFPK